MVENFVMRNDAAILATLESFNQLKGKKAAPQFAIDASVTEKERVKRYTVRESEREEERERGRKKL